MGWRAEDLAAPGATVSGTSTYQHMELMVQKPDYHRFVLAAAKSHTASSLGAVGLACRSCATLAEAIACHGRFQHLTNRTASYEVTLDDDRLVITEHRVGPPRLGSKLISDYAMLIAVHLLRTIAAEPPTVYVMRSRRTDMPDDERDAYSAFLGAPVEGGAPQAQLELDAAALGTAVVTADEELAAYFQGVLHKASGTTADEPELLQDVRAKIRAELLHGAPTAGEIARAMGLGQRTLQRRLADLGHSFADVLEDTRRTMADLLLDDPRMSLSEVAYLLGYAENASFYRAFRRWHGTTPAAYRKGRQG